VVASGVCCPTNTLDGNYAIIISVSGKRHIAVDSQGLPHAVHITTANVTDRKGALEACRLNKDSLSEEKSVFADGG